jgi:hypothetical protein
MIKYCIIRHVKLLILILPISFCGYCFIRFSYWWVHPLNLREGNKVTIILMVLFGWQFPYWPGYHPETPMTESKANMGRGLITRPIWKCPCIKLFITYFQHLEKRHPYWPEKKSRPILTRANMGLDMEMIL